MFKKVLIANRGEIACRIIRTAKKMGILTVAVHSEADRNSLHVRLADEAYCIGPPPALQSYLNISKILEAATATTAEAIHPGYGFLSENPEFAKECAQNNLIFIGPPAHVIEEMGIKSLAKRKMVEAGIPVIPGTTETSNSVESLTQSAKELGVPLLIKADRGGGGKGIRVVSSNEQLQSNLEAVQREAESSFGDTTIILEKFLPDARHIEVQIFRDTHGNCVHLFERDCSLQRRHQKIIEESPAPGLNEDIRHALHEVAIKATNTIGYIGAGTVEFLLDEKNNFYFMEINTRLQVEHPVTESITNLDLVEWQFLVASELPLPCNQEEIPINGHAIEARLYAENPERQFLPSIGEVVHLRFPPPTPNLRIDSGLEQGDIITSHYDPIIAKIIVHGESRDQALCQLQQALRATQIAGVDTNIPFLLKLAESKVLQKNIYNSSLIDSNLANLTSPVPHSPLILALASIYQLLLQERDMMQQKYLKSDKYSLWNTCRGFRLNSPGEYNVSFSSPDGDLIIMMTLTNENSIQISLPDKTIEAKNYVLHGTLLTTYIDDRKITADICSLSNSLVVFYDGDTFKLNLTNLDIHSRGDSDLGNLLAPMPGQIIAIHAEAGATVTKGTPILTLEAMKMEYTISAPNEGVVTKIFSHKGDSVQEGEELIKFTPNTLP